MTPRLLLASTSPHRRALLERLGRPFEVEAPEVDETPLAGEAPADLARRLAEAKARAVAGRHAGEAVLVIGSDQVAELDGTPLGKPGTRAATLAQLRACRGRRVRFHTGLALADARDGTLRSHLEPFAVHFRDLPDTALAAYVDAETPFDAAGGFYSEGLGIVLFEALEGRDPNALVGLPLIALVDLLADAGVAVLDARS
jgi:septum formation protein